jgi:2-dehydro-3-deoxyphosphogluconate aldolase/(4S)-4-hydroxy-2-oxoglutarate aldolase
VIQDFFDTHFRSSPTMAILRGFSPDRTVALCRKAVELGLGLIEVPVQDEAGVAALAAALDWGRATGHPIGAGTVISPALVERVAGLGAAFSVAPNIDLEVAEAAQAAGLPHLPGVATPTEVATAWAAGFGWQKVFPASILGTAWITAMAGPFPRVCFVATGGIDTNNAASYRAAGAVVALGAAFADADPAAVAALTGHGGG